MKILPDVNIKALVFGAAIAGGFIILGYQYWDWFYTFSSVGLLYAGYGQKNLKIGTICGAFASTVLIILTLQGYFGELEEFYLTSTGILALSALILIIGAIVGLVGAWAKKSRLKAIEEHEKQQNIGKNKTKKKKAKAQKDKPKSGFLNKFKK